MSDLRLDWHRDSAESFVDSIPKGDVLVIAGDSFNIDYDQTTKENLKRLVDKFNHTFYVLGNHEWYGLDMANISDEWRMLNELEREIGVDILNRSVRNYNGVVFGGCTSWFPYDKKNKKLEKCLSDFKYIKNSQFIYSMHGQDLLFLLGAVDQCDVIVTHHLPSIECVSDYYKGDPLNCFYVSGFMDKYIGEADKVRAKYWIHGHSHQFHDATIKGIYTCRNPYGYTSIEKTWNFNENFEIEV